MLNCNKRYYSTVRKINSKSVSVSGGYGYETKDLISQKMSKYSLGVGIYDLDNNLIKNFRNNTRSEERRVGKECPV